MTREFVNLICRICMLMVVALLTACNSTYSIEPLLSDDTAKAVLGSRISGLSMDKSGRVSLSSDGSVSLVELTFNKGRYGLSARESGFDQLSFHPVAGMPGLDLVELHIESKKRKTYAIGRRFGDRYALDNFSIDDATWAAVNSNNLKVKNKEGDAIVASRSALMELVRLYTQINANRLDSLTGYDGYFRLAISSKERGDLVLLANEQSCLAMAGHPLDPSVKALKGKLSYGLPMGKIKLAKAKPVCERAARHSLNASVQYAAVRTDYQSMQYDLVVPELNRLIKNEFALAAVMKADMLSNGLIGPKDPETAKALLTDFASSGSVIGQFYLGYFYRYGVFGKADYGAARKQFESILAAQAYAPAQAALADLYVTGRGGAKQLKKARALFQQAAQKDVSSAQLGLGKMLYFGTGGKKDRKAAFKQLNKAAARGLHEAQYMSGFMLAYGQGVTKNEKKARKKLKPAAQSGHTEARAELGRLLLLGLGGKADQSAGRAHLEAAIERGSKKAKRYLQAVSKPAQPLSNVPPARKSELNALLNDKSFELTAQNLAFFGGLGSGMLRQCGTPVKGRAKAEMQKFVLTSANGSLLGTMYSDKDMRKAWASSAQQQTIFSTGIRVGEQIPCAQAERASMGILKALRVSSRGADGGLSPFVKSCRSSFDQRRCQCLADTGRTVMPDIHKRYYNRRIIKTIIQQNPLIGLQIAMTCKISNY